MSVSVVIPTYNRAHLIRRAIESVLRQTYGAVDIVVVDDGSTDNTREVIAEYGSRVRYLRQDNSGVGVARNAGMSLCRGEYIAFLDSDDYWHDFKLQLQCRLLDAFPEAAFTFSEFAVEKDDGSRIHYGSRLWLVEPLDWSRMYDRTLLSRDLNLALPQVSRDFAVYVGCLYRHFLQSAFVLPTTAVVRRSAIDSSTKFTERVAIFEDWEFFARLARGRVAVFSDVETAVNSGHSGPERVTRCSQLSKAQSYLRMVRNVWKCDGEFYQRFGADVDDAECRALLAVAREAVLASRPEIARQALADWRRVSSRLSGILPRRTMLRAELRAAAYRLALHEFGRQLFKIAFVGSKAFRSALHPLANAYPVNPAA